MYFNFKLNCKQQQPAATGTVSLCIDTAFKRDFSSKVPTQNEEKARQKFKLK